MKKCFKCGEEKELSEFYAHRWMADRHLGKCKDCARADAKTHRLIKSKDLKWVKAERARCREKQRRYREAGVAAPTSQATREAYTRRHPEGQRARRIASQAVRRGLIEKPKNCSVCHCQVERLHGHHPDYSKPTTVIWVCPRCHGEIHWKIREQQLNIL